MATIMPTSATAPRMGGRAGEASAPVPLLLRLYTVMARIRAAEERIAELVESGEVRCPCHLYTGQEAVAAGVCAALQPGDLVWGNHRSHGHYLARGGDLRALMAEVFAKATGCSGGRGGSMHLFAPREGILGTVPIVAGTVPLAVGAGLAAKLRGRPVVSVAFFGDGTLDEGHVHESLNLASLYQLPVLFVCENNLYASHMHVRQRRVHGNLFEAGAFYRMPSACEDGNDVVAVHRAARQAAGRARDGGGPALLEFRTFRWRGHVGASRDIDVGVQRRGELSQWLAKDPIARVRGQLTGMEVSPESLQEIDAGVAQEVENAVAFARQSPRPPAEAVLEHVFVTRDGASCEF